MNKKLIRKIKRFGEDNGYIVNVRESDSGVTLSFYDNSKDTIILDVLIKEGEDICNFPCSQSELDDFEMSVVLDMVGMEV
ncbi:hypothetical protein SAMN02745116_00421 [Pilibacter termitis]|uniref:Uncharacterized protein n=1 Tax=Pilibacter termitis TaxID=263852 RepID=A0A1T4KVU1_9ENTE|nr:hypothetical protein [Pilibacter termitis]SJZ46562.1 hypothetical protein SAMN02745116_00421 [Pilibacter termitis]